jgi:hypothetical protein
VHKLPMIAEEIRQHHSKPTTHKPDQGYFVLISGGQNPLK